MYKGADLCNGEEIEDGTFCRGISKTGVGVRGECQGDYFSMDGDENWLIPDANVLKLAE